jgi:tetratricopeptide (TPR) repeat protein
MSLADRLDTWKDISAYLGRSTRTCQNWEALYGLPVHRFDGAPKPRVYAFKRELDEWFERALRETGASRVREAASGGPSGPGHGEGSADKPVISPLAVADKAYWAGRKATERFLATRSPADAATAVDMFEKALREDPGNPLAYAGLGEAYRWDYAFLGMKPDRLERMTASYAKACELAPDLAEACIGLGWSLYFPGDIAGAGAQFARAARLKPGDPGVDLEIGHFLLGLGHFDRAIRRFSRALGDPAAGTKAEWVRALCLEWTGEYETALAAVKGPLRREPTSAYLRCLQARLMIYEGNLADAEAELTLAEALSPGCGDVEFNRALLWAARGDLDMAEKALARPARTTLLRNYIETMVYASLGDPDEALHLIASTIETGFSRLVAHAYPYLYLANTRNRFYDRLRPTPRFDGILARQRRRYEEESARLGDL